MLRDRHTPVPQHWERHGKYRGSQATWWRAEGRNSLAEKKREKKKEREKEREKQMGGEICRMCAGRIR